MPKQVNQKSDTFFRNAKPHATAYRIGDGGGLYMLVNPDGRKAWRWQYARPVTGKRNTLALGDYPEVTAAMARLRRDEGMKLLVENIDPGEQRKQTKTEQRGIAANTFESVAREWMASREGVIEPAQIKKCRARLEKDVFPWLGKTPVTAVTAPAVLAIMRRVDARGTRFTAHKVEQEIGMIMRYAVATGRAERDPTPDLKGAIPPAKETHRAALTEPAKVAELLRAFDAFSGSYPVQCALRLAPMLFVRPGELRNARWADIDLDAAEWRYFVTKTKTDHLVPLSQQAVAILRDLHPLTGQRAFVFPGARDPLRPMSNATLNAALRRMGYDTKTEITAHGFRAMARTNLHERLGFAPEVIEHQLAHKVPDALGAAYNRTKFIADRTRMMQRWSDYLDELKNGAKVLPFKAKAA